MRICTGCGLNKDDTEFHKDKKTKDGLMHKCKACRAQHYINTREDQARRNADWNTAHPTYLQEWRIKNPSKVKVYNHQRRYRYISAGGSFTDSDWDALCSKYNYRCLCCGEKRTLTVDHVLPLIMGGSNSIDNIQPLCRACNSKKNAKHIDYRK